MLLFVAEIFIDNRLTHRGIVTYKVQARTLSEAKLIVNDFVDRKNKEKNIISCKLQSLKKIKEYLNSLPEIKEYTIMKSI